MIPKRLTRALAASGISASLVIGLLAVPMVTLAATPSWVDEGISALPGTVLQGKFAGYRASIRNQGPSNISQLWVTATFSENSGAEVIRLTKDGAQLSCTAAQLAATPGCAVGALTPNQVATLLVGYRVNSSGPTVSLHVEWNSVGVAGPGDNSRGDVLSQDATTSVATDGSDFDGGLSTSANELFDTDEAVGPSNLFATSFRAGSALTPVVIEDDRFLAACPVAQCFGNASENAIFLRIDEGRVFGTPFSVTFQVYKDAVPKGTNIKNLVVVHYFDETIPPRNPAFETIANDCPKGGVPSTRCRNVSWDGKTGTYTIVVWLFENGFVKFH